jgi:hypothetical protein
LINESGTIVNAEVIRLVGIEFVREQAVVCKAGVELGKIPCRNSPVTVLAG